MAIGLDAACANISARAPLAGKVCEPTGERGPRLGFRAPAGPGSPRAATTKSTGAVRTGAGGRERQHPTDMLVCHTPSAPCARLPGGAPVRALCSGCARAALGRRACVCAGVARRARAQRAASALLMVRVPRSGPGVTGRRGVQASLGLGPRSRTLQGPASVWVVAHLLALENCRGPWPRRAGPAAGTGLRGAPGLYFVLLV